MSGRQAAILLLFVAPLFALVAVTYLWPLVGVAGWSIPPATGAEPNPYPIIATDPQIRGIFVRTLRICLLASVVATACAFILSIVWVLGGPVMRLVVEFGVLLPFWISVLVRAFGWIVLLRRNGLVNDGLIGLGVIAEPLELVRNELGVVIGMVHFLIPFAALPIAANMRKIDLRLMLAARGLGAGRLLTFWAVFLPLMRPGLLAAFLVVFVFALGFFVTPAILGGGKVVMIAEYVWLQVAQTSNRALGAGLAVVLFILVAAVGILFQRLFLRPRAGGK